MISRYALVIMTLLISTSSFAASAVLPPLPSQQPPPIVQNSAKSPPPPPVSSTEPTSPPPPHAAESLPPATQVPPQTPTIPTTTPALTPPIAQVPATPPTPSSPASTPTIAPVPIPAASSGAKKSADSTGGESFMDTGQKQLPRVGLQGNEGSTSSTYNASDLRIPIIESEEKEAAKDSVQSNTQASANAPPAAPDVAQAAPAAHTTGPNIALPEAAHSARTLDSGAGAPSPIVAQTPPSQTSTPAVATANPTHINTPPSPLVPSSNSGAAQPSTTPTSPPQSPPLAVVPTTPPASAEVVPASNVAATPPVASAPVLALPVTTPVKAQHEVATTPPAPVVLPEHSEGMNLVHTAKSWDQKTKTARKVVELTADQLKFISDEAIVFTLSDDEVELGELTATAKISQMPAYDYIKLFWKNHETPRDKMYKRDVDLFLAMYETHPSEAYDGAMNYDEASNQAFDAASGGKLSDLRAIISYYSVLQMRDARGNNMLGVAIESDNLEVARFLLIRGIDLHATNYEGYDAFSIARDESNEDASALLDKARFLGRR